MSLAKCVDTGLSNTSRLGTPSNSNIDEEKSRLTSISSKDVAAPTTTATADTHPSRRCMVQKLLLIWMDNSIDESTENCQNTLTQLRSVVNNINIYKSPDECVDFLSEVDDEKVFMIVVGTIGEQIVPLIHEMPQLHAIYIFCDNKSQHEQWSKVWVKVKGVHTQIALVYEALQQAVKQYNQDSIAISFVTVGEETFNQNLDQLEPSFMYTQIFKEILLEMEYDRQSIVNFSTYCRNADYGSLRDINRFEDEYQSHLPIWWYTWPSFIYSILNEALRALKSDSIINMGFFIRDLYRNIEQLHQEQISNHHGRQFTVYRGQGLSTTDVDKLQKTKGGLMSFNNFLSTSKDREVSLGYAIGASTATDMFGILFKMAIDPSISSTPFAAITEVSYFKMEEEVLFSMHTVFRIEEIKKIENNDRLYQVELKLTADDDQELLALTKRIRIETHGSGWQRLGNLLLKIGQLNRAEELYEMLLEQTSDEGEKALYYNQLGYVNDKMGDYQSAVWYQENALEIRQKLLPPNHPDLAVSYNNIGFEYSNMGEYSKVFSFYEKALEIYQRTLPPDHPDLAQSYNNIGAVYHTIGENLKALSFYEKALVIRQGILPSSHPDLAQSYNNIGEVYRNMGEYSKALSFYENTHKIYQKSLPSNHPSFATSYNNIGEVYRNMGDYSKALSFYEQALEIYQNVLPPNHPNLATSNSNIGLVYMNMGEYSKALLFYEKIHKIVQEALFPNHLSLAISYNNIGEVYRNMGDYSKALSFYEKALETYQKTLPSNHSNLATSTSNIGSVYVNMGEFSKALSFYEKALEIQQKTFPSNHPDLAQSYNNIGLVYHKMGEYSKAFSFYEKALEIYQKVFPPNHPDLATSYNNIGEVYRNMGEYSKALWFYEKTCKIFEEILSPNHPSLATSYSNIGAVYRNMGEYSKALSFYEKSLEIRQITLPPNHSDLGISHNNIGAVYYNMGEYLKAVSRFEHALDIWQRSLPPSHPNLQTVRESIEIIKKRNCE